MGFNLIISRRWNALLCVLVISATTFGFAEVRMRAMTSAGSGAPAKYSAEALRENTLGVAYMNQQKPADAEKYFERAIALDSQFAEARLNLGISLVGQQKLEPGRAALEEAAGKLPNDPYAGTTWGWSTRI